jgi:hypothetical protein
LAKKPSDRANSACAAAHRSIAVIGAAYTVLMSRTFSPVNGLKRLTPSSPVA